MESTKWAHLPNATHIDWVINSVKTNPNAWGLVVRDAAWDAALALVAYDDCEKYLDMTPDALQVWAVLSDDPAAILLLPMVQVMQKECADLPA